MEIHLEHYFRAPSPQRILEAVIDPRWEETIRSEGRFAERKTVEERWEGGRFLRKVACSPHPKIVSVIPSIVPIEKIQWVETLWIDPKGELIEWSTLAPHFEEQFHCEGLTRFSVRDDSQICREICGTISVKMPLISSKVEKLIIKFLRDGVDEEAGVLQRFLDETVNS